MRFEGWGDIMSAGLPKTPLCLRGGVRDSFVSDRLDLISQREKARSRQNNWHQPSVAVAIRTIMMAPIPLKLLVSLQTV